MILDTKDITGEIVIRNKRGLEIRYGDTIYYNLLSNELQLYTTSVIVKSILLLKNRVCILYTIHGLRRVVNVEDVFGTEQEAQEVANKWVQNVIRVELLNEIKSYLEKQKKLQKLTPE